MTTYFLNGCEVQSDVPLPCDNGFMVSQEMPHLPFAIYYGGETLGAFSQAHWIAQKPWARCYDVGEGLLVSVTNEFHMLIAANGSSLTLFFDHNHLTAGALAAACAINSGMAACALLRGELALHAASAELDGNLIGVMAPSGTGKSTLLWSLLDCGALLCADDMTTLRQLRLDQPPLALPSTQYTKMRREALNKRGVDEEKLSPLFYSSDAFWLPVEGHRRLASPRPLTALFALNPTSSNCHVHAERVTGGRALSLLNENMQGLWTVSWHINRRRYIEECTRLFQQTPIYVLHYPRCYEALPVLVEAMREIAALTG